MAESVENNAAVYVAFATLKNALDQLAEGVPNRIDRSVFPGLSGGVQAQLLSGMRFLGLIDGQGKPQPALTKIAVSNEAARKRELRTILEGSYQDLFALDLTKTTPAQLGEQMTRSYKATGDTREKAVRFFLSAVEYVGIPVSTLFKKRGSTSSASPRKRRQTRPAATIVDALASSPSNTQKTVTLRSGGFVTVSANADFFRLSNEDRTFVFELIDKLEEYEAESDFEQEESEGTEGSSEGE